MNNEKVRVETVIMISRDVTVIFSLSHPVHLRFYIIHYSFFIYNYSLFIISLAMRLASVSVSTYVS